MKKVNKYIERAINMECISCGTPMSSGVFFFPEGYHIQLCSECRKKLIIPNIKNDETRWLCEKK